MNDIPILYEDDEIYILNKRAGLAVQGGKGISHAVDDIFAKQVGQKIFPVHRLDRDTAGILVVAKSRESARKWTKIFSQKNDGRLTKEYTAFCFGSLPQKKGKIDLPIEVHGEKKTAVTFYSVEKIKTVAMQSMHSAQQPTQQPTQYNADVDDAESAATAGSFIVSKVKLQLGTGRTHQIRIHLAKSGAPIIGDDKYGNFRANKIFRKKFGIKNLLLFASRLVLPIGADLREFKIDVSDIF